MWTEHNHAPFCHGAHHHTEPEPEFAEEVITKKKNSQVSAHRTNTLGTEASGCYRVFLHRKTALLKASLSNIIIFWKLFTLKGLVASIPGTKRRLIPSLFHSFCGSHREKRITPNYPITVAVTHLFYSQDLPDSYHVLGTIPLFQIVTWSWWPDGSSKIIAGKLVCVFTSSKVQKNSFQKYSVLKMVCPSHSCYFLMAACLCYIWVTKKSTQESL